MRIRVLHFAGIINRFDIIDTILTGLDRHKFEIYALTGVAPRQTGAYLPRERYETTCLSTKITRGNSVRLLRMLLCQLTSLRPHIIHAHHYTENLIASVAARLARVPCYIIGRHYSDHIYFLTRGLKRRTFLAGERFCNTVASNIAVPTEAVARILTERQGVPARKVAVIPFAWDSRRCRPSSQEAPARLRREHGLDGRYVVLFCGRLSAEKGVTHLMHAIPVARAANSAFRLVVVGDGPERLALQGLARRLGVEDVVCFTGWRDDALDWIAAADLIVNPALCESWCQVLCEALGFGKPVIMTPVGAAPEIIGNNQRGRLVKTGDSDGLGKAICELMADPELGRHLGELGGRHIAENLLAEKTASLYEELYESALAAATSYGRSSQTASPAVY